MLNILLIGYGRMGREVAKEATLRGHNIVAVIDSEADWSSNAAAIESADMAIDFSLPDLAVHNIVRCFGLGLPVVVGTTAWYARLDEVSDLCIEGNHSLFYAPNFSLGMNIVFRLNKQLAGLVNNTDYQLSISETHHIHKIDAPSGTAIQLANQLVERVDRYAGWTTESSQHNDLLPVTSLRTGEVPGTHEVIAESTQDTIRLVHEAKGRQGFALGAVLAAEFLSGRKGIFNMDQLLDTLVG
jgi:4-hydroxy-tetrahydrodipicolinate reductase